MGGVGVLSGLVHGVCLLVRGRTVAAGAASAAATGGDDKEAQRRLDGKRFSLRLRFGCTGPAPEKDARRGWSFDEKRRLLRVRAASDLMADTQLLKELPLGTYEAAQGFWIDRPWLLVAACPVLSPAAGNDAVPSDPSSPDAQIPAQPMFRLGIVQLYSEDDARTHRRDGRAYEASKTLPEGAKPSAVGYDLVVSGRLKRLTDRSAIACSLGKNPALPPSCVMGAEFDRVAIEEPGDETVLAEWTSI